MHPSAARRDLTGLVRVLPQARIPQHRVLVDVAGRRESAWLLRSLGPSGATARDTLVFPNPEGTVTRLPRELRSYWGSFDRVLRELRDAWSFHALPTLKRVVRLHAQDDRLRVFDIQPVAYHLGAVPALVLGEADGLKIAVLSRRFASTGPRDGYSDAERHEVLASYEDYLHPLLLAYYEQIANYFCGMFFGASDSHAIRFCLRIRQILRESIGTKCRDIERCPQSFPNSHELATTLRTRYDATLTEAHAVDHFAHLLVNHVYRFFCIGDRVQEYADRLRMTACPRPLMGTSSISFLKRCAENLDSPSDGFLEELVTHRDAIDPWLYSLGESSALVAEIAHVAARRPIDRPLLFLTRPFKLPDSERLALELPRVLADRARPVTVIQGRHLGWDIRWSLLARVWLCDRQLLFVPRSLDRPDGTTKHLRRERNWVVLELLYGHLLGRRLTVVASSPVNDDVIEELIATIREYTAEKEIPQVDDALWASNLAAAKAELIEALSTRNYEVCDIDTLTLAPRDFVNRIEARAVLPAADALVEILFEAWSRFFNPRTWSVAQALLLLDDQLPLFPNKSLRHDPVTVADIAAFIARNKRDPRFSWAKNLRDENALTRAVRDHVNELAAFKFVVAERAMRPIRVTKGKALRVQAHVAAVAHELCSAFGAALPDDAYSRVRARLLDEHTD